MSKIFIISGIIIFLIGIFIHFFGSMFGWFGNLYGNIKFTKSNFTFYSPITSMIVVSIILTFLIVSKKSKLYGKNGDMHENFDHKKLYECISKRKNWAMKYNN